MANINFKINDPIAQLISSSGGDGLPLTGGTLTGNLTMQVPAKVVQCQTPSNPCDVVNLIYLQSLYLPLAGGTMSGAISQPLAPIAANDVTNKAYVDSLIGGGPFLPLAGGVMSGAISQPLAPVAVNDVTNKAYVDAQATPDATTLVKGKIQLAGDLTGNASMPVIDVNKVTYPKIQQVTGFSLLGNPSGVLANVQEIALGSLVFTSNLLNSPLSFYSGTDPNVTTPTDRPAANNTVYQGTDNYLWTWNGLSYNAITPKKFISFAKNLNDQTMVLNDLVEFSPTAINQTSTQGLTITDATNGSIFTITLDANRPNIQLKITVSISGLYTTGVIAKFFTFNLTTSSYTGSPGLILNNGNATQITSTHMYSEILTISPGSIDIGVRLRNITGGASINIGNGGGVPLPYRWILFEEV